MARRKIQMTVKTVTLAIAIVAGLFLQHGKAQARDIQTTILAGGCFWCVEADFDSVPGVIDTVSGFAGGNVANPSYRQVSNGGTGHLEVVQITYDADRVSYPELLHLFMRSIDPTDGGGQFCDRGQQYTTAIFVSNASERAAAEAAIADAQQALGQPIRTAIRNSAPFYPAEEIHQNYYRGDRTILTRRGPMRQSRAYDFYRESCGRDARVQQLWGSAAPFTH